MTDIRVRDEGTVVGFQPVTEAGRGWIDDNVVSEGWQWMGDTLWVDNRVAADLLRAVLDAGLAVGP